MDDLQAHPSRERILVVDDEPHVLSALRRALHKCGFEILTAPAVPEALEVLAAGPVDVIISDMRMPGQTGAELLARARQIAPDAVRILLTGYADMQATLEAVNEGEVFRFLTKPWEDPLLIQAIREGLDRRSLERERDALREITARQNEELRQLNEGLERTVAQRTHQLQATLEQLKALTQQLKADFSSTVKLLSSLIESRTGITSGSPRAVAQLVRKVAPSMLIGAETLNDLTFAALLEDIGKVGLPDELLAQPFEALHQDGRARLMRHPVTGEGLLMALPSLSGAGVLLRHLYENYDGSGGPRGLSGSDIPLASRLLRVLTDFEHYRCGAIELTRLSDELALQRLRRWRGKRYDPDCVDALVEAVQGQGRTPQATALLSSAQLRPGMVLAQDLLSAAGVLLLAQGHAFDESLIHRIRAYERATEEFLWVCVVVNGAGTPAPGPMV
jgi:response regulator RpfG family c-di-GMP phosphodiesterase